MNSKSVGTFTNGEGEDTGRVEVFEADSDGDLELVLYDATGKSLGGVYMAPSNAREIAVALIVATEGRL